MIDDLAIEWTPEFKETGPFDDDFEVIDTFEPKNDVAPEPQAPLSLFDETHVDKPVEVGAQRAIIHLEPPPPRIQQAPKSEKLPIPLYPGFRCSIFAIVKQPSNAGPHSSEIKITGKVLGRDVVFQIPVAPVSVDNHVLEGIGGGKLLHTLAAKQLIQVFEDLAKTPENKAEIERLGKRYSLASSVTSFVAIDEDEAEVEVHIPHAEAVVQDRQSGVDDDDADSISMLASSICSAASSSPMPVAPSPLLEGSRMHSVGPPLSRFLRATAGDSSSSLSSASSSSMPVAPSSQPVDASFGAPATTAGDNPFAAVSGSTARVQPYAISSPRRSGSPRLPTGEQVLRMSATPFPLPGADAVESFDRLTMPHDRDGSPRRITYRVESPGPAAAAAPLIQAHTTGSAGPSLVRVQDVEDDVWYSNDESGEEEAELASDGEVEVEWESYSRKRRRLAAYSFSGSSIKRAASPSPRAPLAPAPVAALTVENLARAQGFDGSFPSTEHHMQFLFGMSSSSTPETLPASLAALSCAEEVKKTLWSTILTLACLDKTFKDEKDAWEMLAEKATEFVLGVLESECGLSVKDAQRLVMELETTAATYF